MDYAEVYREAVQREQLERDAAFLGVTERIGPFEVKPLTLRHYLALRTTGNPFLTPGAAPTPSDLFALLWLLSPQYGQAKAKRRLLRACRALFFEPEKPRFWKLTAEAARANFDLLTVEAVGFIMSSLQDHPPSRGETAAGPSYYSDGAAMVDLFGTEYGWPDSVTLDTPMRRLFQYQKIIHGRRAAKAGKEPLMFNPSDRIKSHYLETENQNDNPRGN